MPETGPFSPDWCVAPAVTLRDWMTEHGVTVRWLMSECAEDGNLLGAYFLIKDVLGRRPLTGQHAAALERATGISAQFWLGYERNYRDDLAAGRTDTTPEDTDG